MLISRDYCSEYLLHFRFVASAGRSAQLLFILRLKVSGISCGIHSLETVWLLERNQLLSAFSTQRGIGTKFNLLQQIDDGEEIEAQQMYGLFAGNTMTFRKLCCVSIGKDRRPGTKHD